MNTQHMHTRLFLLVLLVILLRSGASQAQGFVQQYPFFTWYQGGAQSMYPQADSSFRLTALAYPDFGIDVELVWLNTDAQGNLVQSQSLTTPNSGSPWYGNDIFLLENGGYYRAYADSNQVWLQRFDAAGVLLWDETHTVPGTKYPRLINVVANAAEAVFVRYFASGPMFGTEGYLLKFAPNGAFLWESSFPFQEGFVYLQSLQPLADGGCLFNNSGAMVPNSFTDEYLLRFDSAGNLSWFYAPENGRLFPHFKGQVFDVNSAGETILFACTYAAPGNPSILRLDWLNAGGALVDSFDINSLLGKSGLEGQLALATADGGAVVVVLEYPQNIPSSTVAKIRPDGSLAWQRSLDFLLKDDAADFAAGKELPDGSFILYAYQGEYLYLIKISADGIITSLRPSPQYGKNSLPQLRLVPNPAAQSTVVQLDELYRPGRRLVLRDSAGRLVQEWQVQELRQEILRGAVPPGLYWLELYEQEQRIAVGKLLWMK